ncbi:MULTISPECIES: hypothetical protein [Streptomyces]|uniref:Flagellar hook-length control protein FliK n=2 Tax=Streptomyces TaxID=1883 RepID=A0ABV9IRB8_9ACTN
MTIKAPHAANGSGLDSGVRAALAALLSKDDVGASAAGLFQSPSDAAKSQVAVA